MTTQDSTHGTDTDQYRASAPEDAGRYEEQGRQGSYADQHSSDLREAEVGDGRDRRPEDVPVRDAQELPRDDAARTGDATDHAANGHARADGADAGRGSTRQDSGDVAPTLIPADRAGEFKGRWTEMKADFVDEPRDTVRKIDGLVGEVLDELNEVFKRQRGELERDLKNDEASTEDLRVAFRRYREFFERLLSV
jgi:hypothetical protein